jgi:hypothetical protein
MRSGELTGRPRYGDLFSEFRQASSHKSATMGSVDSLNASNPCYAQNKLTDQLLLRYIAIVIKVELVLTMSIAS